MKSLKSILSKYELNEVLEQLAGPNTVIDKSSNIVTVKKNNRTCLSAISNDGILFAVMADELMFPSNCYWGS